MMRPALIALLCAPALPAAAGNDPLSGGEFLRFCTSSDLADNGVCFGYTVSWIEGIECRDREAAVQAIMMHVLTGKMGSEAPADITAFDVLVTAMVDTKACE